MVMKCGKLISENVLIPMRFHMVKDKHDKKCKAWKVRWGPHFAQKRWALHTFVHKWGRINLWPLYPQAHAIALFNLLVTKMNALASTPRKIHFYFIFYFLFTTNLIKYTINDTMHGLFMVFLVDMHVDTTLHNLILFIFLKTLTFRNQ